MPIRNPCDPSPCGPNSRCSIHDGEKAACTCLPEMKGIPPNCRPECLINQDCPSTRSCISGKCVDSCKGACGSNSVCQVIDHVPLCSCYDSYEGDPYSSGCVLRQGKILIYFLGNIFGNICVNLFHPFFISLCYFMNIYQTYFLIFCVCTSRITS
jgi:hypothetical protein